MNERFNLLKSAKYIVLAVFLILSIISVLLFGKVGINYNISDYLDDETDTKISLGIMEEEFGLISNIQVMIEDVDADEAQEIKSTIKAVENVVFVNFDSQNSDYYKDNTALFVVLVNGSEYSEIAIKALADIQNTLADDYGERMELGGAVIEKQLLQKAIQGEIVMILAISLCLVAVLMLITAGSWIEPLILLAASGVAVLLNMGTNVIFGEISYITNSIAAILQLALSVDYSIVLLHAYRKMKTEQNDNERAMLCAIKEVVKPVSASALTTIAGLLALLFMSFTIGFDIGIVLMKSIVISAITSLTLLPAMLLVLDKLMQKTAKKPLVISGTKLCDFSMKFGKLIMPIAFFIIIVGCVLNIGNSYNFVDSCNSNEKISDKFGQSGTLIVLYENTDDAREKEELLASLIESYKKEDGTELLKSQVSYSSTVGQIFDVEKASRDLGLSLDDAELLFTIYRFTEDESAVKLDVKTFIDFAIDLIENDEDAADFVRPEYKDMLSLLLSFDELMEDRYTADEFYSIISSLDALEGVAIDESAVKQLYGNRFFSDVANKKVAFADILLYLIDSGYLDGESASSLEMLISAKAMIDEMPELPAPNEEINLTAFTSLIKDFGLTLPEGVSPGTLWLSLGLSPRETIQFKDLFARLLNQYDSMLPEDLTEALDRLGTRDYTKIYGMLTTLNTTFESQYSHTELLPALKHLAVTVTGEAPSLPTGDEADDMMKQLYIMYYIDDGRMPDGEMGCIELIDYVTLLIGESQMIADRLPSDAVDMLEALKDDAILLDGILDDTEEHSYSELSDILGDLLGNVQSIEIDASLSESAIMGVYIKYAVANEIIETGSIAATDLLAFVIDAAENNELLASRIDEEMKETIKESEENIKNAERLLIADNYSRILLTVNLPPESEESSKFVEYLSSVVHDVFGEKAYVAGEIATTNDLIKAFDYDNKFISIFTVISIFLIIMIVFKSLSLPIILVAVIQGAIWIAMSMSLVAGPMFFMSYIMSMCILMGATIDYGILLSTSYTRNRATLGKEESLQRAIDTAIPTVFTSGLILMVCGLVVGLIATQTSISSVGFLLFRGTLVSVIMVMLVLPAVLYLLDSFVMKLTMNQESKPLLRIYEKIRNSLTKDKHKNEEEVPGITENTQTEEQSE